LNKKFLHSEIGKALGEVANIVAYGEHFVFYAPDRPDPVDWEDEFDGPRVRLEYSTEYSQFIKRKSMYESKCTQAYHMMKARCSPSMWNAVKEHPDFQQWDREQDALALWLRIQDISLNGTGLPENDSKKKNEARHRFDRVHQKQNESVGDFYSRFIEHYDAMVSQGANLIQLMIPEGLEGELLEEVYAQHRVDEEAMKAISFLNKLDKSRFSTLLDDLENAKQFGRDEYPTTVVDAYAMANRYRKNGSRLDTLHRGRADRYDAAFAATESKGNPKGNKGNKGQKDKKKDGVNCYHCDEAGHVRNHCPQLVKALQYFMKTGKSFDQLKDEIVVLSFKGLEEFIMAESSARPFTKDDLLLDNQASISVICNPDLVYDIREADSGIVIEGVGKGKLKTTLIANLPGIGVVYFNPDAIANILCFYDINNRFGVKFDSKRFSVEVPELKRTLLFKPVRKLYVCKNVQFLSNMIKNVLVSTSNPQKECDFSVSPTEPAHMVSDEVSQLSQADPISNGIDIVTSIDNYSSSGSSIGAKGEEILASIDRKVVENGVQSPTTQQLYGIASAREGKHINRESTSNMMKVDRDIMVSTPSVVKILDRQGTAQARNMNAGQSL
jgi:hypothetical protein